MLPNNFHLRFWLLTLVLFSSGCHRYLVATPHVLLQPNSHQLFTECEKFVSPDLEIVYATDRAVNKTNSKGPVYGYGRAKWLAYGTANVTFNPRPTWKELIEDSTRSARKKNYALQSGSIHEAGRFTPMLQVLPSTAPMGDIQQAVAQELEKQSEGFHNLLRNRLAMAPQKDVYVFIHGVNNTFEDGVFRAAEVWHFMGRTGVPVAYSWPAGLGGLRGYLYDRESGEFTVFHLKHFLKSIADCPDVHRVHLVAHSRGADVTVTALRELNLFYQGRGQSLRDVLKLENLILAAPDMDEDVFMQRFAAERLIHAANRTTIYSLQGDRAIEFADVLFASKKRVGSLGAKDIGPAARKMLAQVPNLQFIQCNVGLTFGINHAYVYDHPAVLSDLILVLRDRRGPGPENGRPLIQPVEGIWELNNNYLLQAHHLEKKK